MNLGVGLDSFCDVLRNGCVYQRGFDLTARRNLLEEPVGACANETLSRQPSTPAMKSVYADLASINAARENKVRGRVAESSGRNFAEVYSRSHCVFALD